eukprot:2328978-Alexandrium_andersonii.AAC.1
MALAPQHLPLACGAVAGAQPPRQPVPRTLNLGQTPISQPTISQTPISQPLCVPLPGRSGEALSLLSCVARATTPFITRSGRDFRAIEMPCFLFDF